MIVDLSSALNFQYEYCVSMYWNSSQGVCPNVIAHGKSMVAVVDYFFFCNCLLFVYNSVIFWLIKLLFIQLCHIGFHSARTYGNLVAFQ